MSSKLDYYATQLFYGLWIGGEQAGSELERLTASKITHILVAAKELKPEFPGKFVYLHLPIEDEEEFRIDEFFNLSNFFIKEARSEGNVLVHCKEGKSRSVTLILAYLICERKMSVDEALNIVKKKRPWININSGFVDQLLTYEKAVSLSK